MMQSKEQIHSTNIQETFSVGASKSRYKTRWGNEQTFDLSGEDEELWVTPIPCEQHTITPLLSEKWEATVGLQFWPCDFPFVEFLDQSSLLLSNICAVQDFLDCVKLPQRELNVQSADLSWLMRMKGIEKVSQNDLMSAIAYITEKISSNDFRALGALVRTVSDDIDEYPIDGISCVLRLSFSVRKTIPDWSGLREKFASRVLDAGADTRLLIGLR